MSDDSSGNSSSGYVAESRSAAWVNECNVAGAGVKGGAAL